MPYINRIKRNQLKPMASFNSSEVHGIVQRTIREKFNIRDINQLICPQDFQDSKQIAMQIVDTIPNVGNTLSRYWKKSKTPDEAGMHLVRLINKYQGHLPPLPSYFVWQSPPVDWRILVIYIIVCTLLGVVL